MTAWSNSVLFMGWKPKSMMEATRHQHEIPQGPHLMDVDVYLRFRFNRHHPRFLVFSLPFASGVFSIDGNSATAL